jgi:F-type H+-transporting ATPase subunit gamma
MASQRDIRRRIRSVKNTGQLTRAMQLMAATRMRRAQQRVLESRPYADAIRAMLANLGTLTGTDRDALQEVRDVRTIGVVVVTPDRGLCGALPGNVNRAVARFVASKGTPAKYVTVGRKGRDYVARLRLNMIADHSGYGDYPGIDVAESVAAVVIGAFRDREVDAVYLAYPKLISMLRQEPTVVQLLPVEDTGLKPSVSSLPALAEAEERGGPKAVYEFEPSAQEVLSALLPRYVEVQIFQALLESKASEQSARMVAMQNATDNANEIVDALTLTYNKVRQANITREIAEITGGAAALAR